jgi:hypothetical protein
MKTKLYYILIFALFLFCGYGLASYINYQSKIRQLTKEKLRLEIQLLKIEIEQSEINLQKEY